MAFQKCPACNGTGVDQTVFGASYGSACTVCRGQKIINERTGMPPYEIVTTNGSNTTLIFDKFNNYNPPEEE